MNNKEWYKQAKFGMFIHWGLYSIPAGEWKGQRTDKPAEWLMTYYRIPIKEYEKLATVFNPIYFDAEEWVKLAKNAGMKYIVFTAKHQEGFAMFKSDVDKYNIVDATPFKRDVVDELANTLPSKRTFTRHYCFSMISKADNISKPSADICSRIKRRR